MKDIRLFIIALACTIHCAAQENSEAINKSDIANITKAVAPIFLSDSLKSSNYKDNFVSFYQLALHNIIGTEKEIQFSSNPFAIMARGNKSLLIDTNYLKYRHLRDINFNVDILLGPNFHLSGFNAGVKYALVNARDITVSKKFIKDILNSEEGKEFEELGEEEARLSSKILKKIKDPDLKNRVADQLHRLFAQDSKFTYRQMDKDVKKEVDAGIEQLQLMALKRAFELYPDVNLYEVYTLDYNRMKDAFMNKPLWTIGANISALDQLRVSGAVFDTELLFGWSGKDGTRSLEMDIKALFNMANDSLSPGNDLQRMLGTFEPGVNFIFRTRDDSRSVFEFKLSGSYYHTFSTLYPGERADSVTLNLQIRPRVFADIWTPITFKYDPYNGNLFGYLNITTNFTAMLNVLKGKNE